MMVDKLLVIVCAFIISGIWCVHLSDEERRLFLNEHNQRRAELARGDVPNLLSAANMNRLEWDNQLAQMANERAAHCEYKYDRRDSHNDNLAYSVMKNRVDSIKLGIRDWWDEYKYFHYTNSYSKHEPDTKHFTQMAWASTQRLGCAVAENCDGEFLAPNSTIIICLYAPWGNTIGREFYKAGETCSMCAADTNCVDALCTKKHSEAAKLFQDNVQSSSKLKRNAVSEDNNIDVDDSIEDDFSKELWSEEIRRDSYQDNDEITSGETENVEEKKKKDLKENNERDSPTYLHDNVDPFNYVHIAQNDTQRLMPKKHFDVEAVPGGSKASNETKLKTRLAEIPRGYYCFARVPSICELAYKYDINVESSL